MPPIRCSRVDLPAPDAPTIAMVSPATAEKEIPRNTSMLSPLGEEKVLRRSLTASPTSNVQRPTFACDRCAWSISGFSPSKPSTPEESDVSCDFGLWTLDLLRAAQQFSGVNPGRRACRINRRQNTQHECNQCRKDDVVTLEMQRHAANRINIGRQTNEVITVNDERRDCTEQDSGCGAAQAKDCAFNHENCHDAIRRRTHGV